MLFSSLFGTSKPAAVPVPEAAPAAAPAAPPAASREPAPSTAAPAPPTTSPTTSPTSSSPRALKQLGLFFAGATFFALSVTVTRRSVARKQRAAALKFYEATPTVGGRATFESVSESTSSSPSSSSSPPSFVALEALNLATLNVVSFFVMLTGGAAWALDLSSLADVRQRMRQFTRGPGLNGGGEAQTDAEAEREVEEWMARMLKAVPAAVGGTKGGEAEAKGTKEEKGEEK